MYRVGIVGLTEIASGRPWEDLGYVWGPRHAASHAAAYAQRGDVDVVAICDLNPSLMDDFRSKWSDRWPHINGFTSLEEMIATSELDLLSVCTGDHVHAEIVVKAAQMGVRGILCEKPIATTLQDADKMIDAVRSYGCHMVIDHTRRWLPEFVIARKLIQEGEIGEVRSVESSWFGPRAMLFRNGTHLLDAMLYLVDGDPDWVLATLPNSFKNYGPRYAGDGGRDPATDPDASAIFGLKSGIRGMFHLVSSSTIYGEIRVVGDRGAISIGQDGSGYVPEHAEIVKFDTGGLAFRRPLQRDQYIYGSIGAAVNELIGLLEGKVDSPTSSPEDARKTLSLCLGILQSSHLGKKVKFPIEDM